MARKKRIPQHESVWRSVRRKAPKVPDITCPAIDDVIQRLDTLSNTTKRLSTAQNKTLVNKLEKLRTANEQLRDSGVYWHDACKSVIEKYLRKKSNKY
jgi:hypothetical protein